MELLEFKNKILKLCKVENISQIGEVLLDVVQKNNIEFYDIFSKIINEEKDWLQALWQYYEADRTEKKQDYTPKSLCKLVSALAGDCKTLYDCCGGSGALTISMLENKNIDTVLVEELDKRVIPFLLFNLCLHNTKGYVVNGNSLTEKKNKIYKLTQSTKYSKCEEVEDLTNTKVDVAISNPPYNIKWNPPVSNDERFPVIPPANNANYAFVLNCLCRANKAILILPNGTTTENNVNSIREYLVKNDFIETIITLPDKMFEATSISTCIMVLNKNKKNKGKVCFIDSRQNYCEEEREQNGQYGGASHTNRTYKKKYKILTNENIKKITEAIKNTEEIAEFSAMKTNEEIAENDYILSPSRYIAFKAGETIHRPFQEIADNINYILKMQNSCKLTINETIAKKLGLDIEIFKKSKENSINLKKRMETIGIKIETEDFIQFTKNKNEIIFKCNDKKDIPDIFLYFFNIWKSQISLLSTMENNYLEELRNALLPDLMSGKIKLEV